MRFFLLLPFSFLYGIIISVRNFLYDWGILRSHEFDTPVVSVGNLAMGGTGKTPCIEFIINKLQKERRIAVLSRGYKRATNGFVLADENSTAQTIGDEPFQILRKFPKITVAVNEYRKRGIDNLLKISPKPELILLDDAFQHRQVKPSLQILLTDFNKPFVNDSILPGGNLRECRRGMKRADIVLVTKCPQNIQPIEIRIFAKKFKLRQYQNLFFATQIYREIAPVFPSETIENFSIEKIKNGEINVLVVAGIANPQSLIEYVKSLTNRVEALIFADHHAFSDKDIAAIKNRFFAISAQNKIILTTEKDAVRLPASYPDELKQFTYTLPVEMKIINNQEEEFTESIINELRR
jgi:tetraacyldisaccharide 4'-kinase